MVNARMQPDMKMRGIAVIAEGTGSKIIVNSEPCPPILR